MLDEPSAEDDAREWSAMSLAAFETAWDNDDDAIYDEWQSHYAETIGSHLPSPGGEPPG